MNRKRDELDRKVVQIIKKNEWEFTSTGSQLRNCQTHFRCDFIEGFKILRECSDLTRWEIDFELRRVVLIDQREVLGRAAWL